MVEVDLIVVGARAKAAAIAAKVHVLNSLALGPIMLEIIEANERAEKPASRCRSADRRLPCELPIRRAGGVQPREPWRHHRVDTGHDPTTRDLRWTVGFLCSGVGCGALRYGRAAPMKSGHRA
jgi:hypothetical protein